LNNRGKFLIIIAVALVLLIVIINNIDIEKPDMATTDTGYITMLEEAQTPEWIDVQYIDMGNNNARHGEALEEFNGIVVHYVANPGTSAAQNRSYFNNPGTEVNSHFIVGLEGEIIQCVPLYEKSVASNERNRDTISIEVCHPDESGKFNQATYDSLVRLTAWLRELGGLKEDDIIRHYDITGKLCPKYYVEHEDEWIKFKQDVMDYSEDA